MPRPAPVSERPTVLWLLANRLTPGGSLTHFANLAHAFDHHAVRLLVCAPNLDDPEIARPFEGSGATLLPLPALASRRAGYLPAVVALARLLRLERVDLLHSVWAKGDLLGALARLFARTPRQVASLEVSYLATGARRQAVYRTLFRWFTGRRLDAVIALSPRSACEFLAQVPYGGRVEVVPLGIDLARFAPLPPRPADGAVVFGAMGRLIPEKGFDDLFRAFARVLAEAPEARLLLGGDGPEEARLRALAASLQLDGRVQFAGWVSDPRAFFEGIDVFVFPSRPAFDGVPNVVVESVALGRPAVATDVGGVGSVVEDGVTGVLVPPRDDAALARGMLRAAADAPHPASPLRTAALARVRHHHARTTEAARILALYRGLLPA